MSQNKWINTETILSYSQKFDLMQQYLEEKFQSQKDQNSKIKNAQKKEAQQEQPQITPLNFKAEIQRRYEASQANKNYKFPLNGSLNSSNSDSSLDSIKYATIYELKSQNNKKRASTNFKQISSKPPFVNSNKRLTTEPSSQTKKKFFQYGILIAGKNGMNGSHLNKSELNAKMKFEELLKEKSPVNKQQIKISEENNHNENTQNQQQQQQIKHVQVNVSNLNISDYKKIEVKLNGNSNGKPKCIAHQQNQQRAKLISSTANTGNHCFSYQQQEKQKAHSKLQEKQVNSQMMKQEITKHCKVQSDGEKILLSEYLRFCFLNFVKLVSRTGKDEEKLNISSQNGKKFLQYQTTNENVKIQQKNPRLNKPSSTNIQELLRSTQAEFLEKKQGVTSQNLYKKLKGNLLKNQLRDMNQLEEPGQNCFQDITNTDLTNKGNRNGSRNNNNRTNLTNYDCAQSPSNSINSISFKTKGQFKCSSNCNHTKNNSHNGKEKTFISPLNSVIPSSQASKKTLTETQQNGQRTLDQSDTSKINISSNNQSTFQPKKISSAKLGNINNLKNSNSQKRSMNLKQQQEKILSLKQNSGKQSNQNSNIQNSTVNSHISPTKFQNTSQSKNLQSHQYSNQQQQQQLSQQQNKCKKIYSIEKIKVNLQEANRRTEISQTQKRSLLNNYFQEKSSKQSGNQGEFQFSSNNLISPTQARYSQISQKQIKQQPLGASTIENKGKKKYTKGKTLSSYQNQFHDIKSLKIYQNINAILKENNNNLNPSALFKL